MLRNKIILIYLIIASFLYGEKGIIELRNTTKNDGSKEIPKEVLKELPLGFPILPKGFYIGNLADFESKDFELKDLITFINSFCVSIKGFKINIEYLDKDYRFIFTHSIADGLKGELLFWHIGEPDINDIWTSVDIELYYKERVVLVNLTLKELDNNWKIFDIVLEENDRGIFDPSTH